MIEQVDPPPLGHFVNKPIFKLENYKIPRKEFITEDIIQLT
jgi:hypothetical protein